MRNLETVFLPVSDWSVSKMSVLSGREMLSRDQRERFDWLTNHLSKLRIPLLTCRVRVDSVDDFHT